MQQPGKACLAAVEGATLAAKGIDSSKQALTSKVPLDKEVC